MSEIYRNSINKTVTFDIDTAPTSARFQRGTLDIVVPITDTNKAVIPYDITRVDGPFDVVWSYSVQGKAYTKTDEHHVITPYFTKDELVAWDSDFALLDDAAVLRLENNVRGVIQTVTDQKFGLEYETISFKGTGGPMVSLPKRLVSTDGLNDPSGVLLDSTVWIGNDGWTLNTKNFPTWVDDLASTNPIRNPFVAYGAFGKDTYYSLTGYWGYESVPSDISLAAKILAEDYGCDESLWRDRYIGNIRAADWRFEFNTGAFQKTGNVKVDQILGKYTLNRMVVL